MVLGVCGFFGSVLFSRFYGRHRFPIFRAGLLGLLVALMCFLPSAAFMPSMIACCMLLGTISTLFNVTMQAELIRNCSLAAAPVAMSIFSGIFNVGIGGGTFIGGRLAAASMLPDIGFVGAAIAACAVLFGLLFYLPHARRQAKQEKVK